MANITGGIGADRIIGTSANDVLQGRSGDDTLRGLAGDDVLLGEDGKDQLIGGTSDSTTAVSARDTILDFSRAGGDKIDLSAFTRTFSFIGTSGFTGKAMELHAVSTGSGLLIEGDINGNRVADFAILVAGVAGLTASDFIL